MEKVIGFSTVSFLCFLTKKLISKTEITQNTGIEKKGKNQTIAAKTAPRMGLSTFPIVLDVSIIPSVLLASSSRWNMSPTSGNTIGIAPDAPIPWSTRPTRINEYGFSIFQDTQPAINPPIPVIINAGIITFLRPNRSDKYPAIGIRKIATIEYIVIM